MSQSPISKDSDPSEATLDAQINQSEEQNLGEQAQSTGSKSEAGSKGVQNDLEAAGEEDTTIQRGPETEDRIITNIQTKAKTQKQTPTIAVADNSQKIPMDPTPLSKNTDAKNWVDDRYILEAFKENGGSETKSQVTYSNSSRHGPGSQGNPDQQQSQRTLYGPPPSFKNQIAQQQQKIYQMSDTNQILPTYTQLQPEHGRLPSQHQHNPITSLPYPSTMQPGGAPARQQPFHQPGEHPRLAHPITPYQLEGPYAFESPYNSRPA